MIFICRITAPVFNGTVKPESQLAYEGSIVYITCFSLFSPMWSRNGKTIDSAKSQLLILHDVTEEDTGVYTCDGVRSGREKFTAASVLYVGGKSQ